MARHEPSELRLLFGIPGFIDGIGLKKVIMPHTHVRQFRSRAGGTKLAAAANAPGNFHRGQARSTGRIPAEVWDGRIAHRDCLEAPHRDFQVRSSKQPSPSSPIPSIQSSSLTPALSDGCRHPFAPWQREMRWVQLFPTSMVRNFLQIEQMFEIIGVSV